jgi:hypothetical protein
VVDERPQSETLASERRLIMDDPRFCMCPNLSAS